MSDTEAELRAAEQRVLAEALAWASGEDGKASMVDLIEAMRALYRLRLGR